MIQCTYGAVIHAPYHPCNGDTVLGQSTLSLFPQEYFAYCFEVIVDYIDSFEGYSNFEN